MTARNGSRLGAPPVQGDMAPAPRPAWVPLATGAALAFGLAWLLFRDSPGAPPGQDDEEDAPDVEYLPPEPSGPHESYELEDEPEDVEVEPA